MNTATGNSGFRAFGTGLRAGLSWRVLLLWALLSLLPTALVALPLAGMLGDLLDHSVYAADWARQINGLMFTDVSVQLARNGGDILNGLAVLAFLLAMLLSPFLTGMYVASARAARTLGFGELLQGGLREYGRMFRMLLIAAVVLGIAAALGGAAMAAAADHADQALTEASAGLWGNLALTAMAILLVFGHATIESGRAQFAADATLHSAIRGWWRGVKQLFRRPLSSFGIYLVVTVIGLLVFALIAALRARIVGFNLPMVLLGFLVTQIGVMVLAWMRGARLIGLAGLAEQHTRAPSPARIWNT